MQRPIGWHDIIRGSEESPPVLFLHGFMGGGADWTDVVDSLQGEFRCICPDLPGHGTTRGEAGLSMEETAAALLERLDRLCIPRCSLVGYSMGGRLALFLALRYPERFDRVLLESASPGLKNEETQAQRRQQDELLARRLDAVAGDAYAMLAFVTDWYKQPLFATLDPESGRVNQMIDRRMKNQAGPLAAVLRAMGVGAQPNLWPELETYKLPTLALAGEMDRKFCFIAEAMSEACPRIAVQEVECCGHNVHFENPDAFVTVARSFLSSPGTVRVEET